MEQLGLIEKIKEALPHGSGIDLDWGCEEFANGSLRFYNGFHCMDEWGGYDRWADFYILIKDGTPLTDFTLHFSGPDSQYANQKYMLRDYLEETIYHALYELEKEMKVAVAS